MLTRYTTIYACRLCSERFGWSNQKADELLLPVLKEYSKHEVWNLLTSFLLLLKEVNDVFESELIFLYVGFLPPKVISFELDFCFSL